MRHYQTSHQLHLFQVAEIRVTFSPSVPPFRMPKIISSQSFYDIMISFWDRETICYEERFCVAYLNQANQVLGIHTHSTGGIAGTVADTRQILGIALKGNACSLCLCHNHPSGNTRPSDADISLTESIRKGAKTMGLTLLDHLIITPSNYYSFADEGRL